MFLHFQCFLDVIAFLKMHKQTGTTWDDLLFFFPFLPTNSSEEDKAAYLLLHVLNTMTLPNPSWPLNPDPKVLSVLYSKYRQAVEIQANWTAIGDRGAPIFHTLYLIFTLTGQKSLMHRGASVEVLCCYCINMYCKFERPVLQVFGWKL